MMQRGVRGPCEGSAKRTPPRKTKFGPTFYVFYKQNLIGAIFAQTQYQCTIIINIFILKYELAHEIIDFALKIHDSIFPFSLLNPQSFVNIFYFFSSNYLSLPLSPKMDNRTWSSYPQQRNQANLNISLHDALYQTSFLILFYQLHSFFQMT